MKESIARKRARLKGAGRRKIDPVLNKDRGEFNDCVVCAICFVTQKPYWEVWNALQASLRRERKPNTGYYMPEWLRALKRLDVEFVLEREERKYTHVSGSSDGWTMPHERLNTRTVSAFKRENPQDRYLLEVNGHLIGLSDGILNDDSRRNRLLNYVLITAIDGESL